LGHAKVIAITNGKRPGFERRFEDLAGLKQKRGSSMVYALFRNGAKHNIASEIPGTAKPKYFARAATGFGAVLKH
jgi:hypothetical protein